MGESLFYFNFHQQGAKKVSGGGGGINEILKSREFIETQLF